MGTITGQQVSDRAGVLLLDEEADRWPESERLEYLNEALFEAARYKPDVSVATTTASLVAGSRQNVPSGMLGVVDIPRNTGEYTRPVRVIARKTLDRNLGDWHGGAQNPEVECFCLDDRNPKTFFVYPPNDGTGQVEGAWFALPTILTAMTDTIPFDDTYAAALVDYVVARCMMKDSDAVADASVANTYITRFYSQFGMTESVEATNSPNAVGGGA